MREQLVEESTGIAVMTEVEYFASSFMSGDNSERCRLTLKRTFPWRTMPACNG